MKRSEVEACWWVALTHPDRVGTVPTPRERMQLEVADLGLDEFETASLVLHVYVNIGRVCVKKLVPPRQTCPQRLHPLASGVGRGEALRQGAHLRVSEFSARRRLPVVEA